nr:teashirt homolog 2 isoform X2 [Doryrhamphus excisus]
MPDDKDGALQDGVAEEDDEGDALTEEERSEKTSPKVSEDRDPDNRSSNSYSDQNSPASLLSNREAELEAELESHLSDACDRLADFKNSEGFPSKDETGSSLQKMRAAYANFLSDSYWAAAGAELKAGKTSSKAKCDSTDGGTKSDFDWHQDALSKTLQQTPSPKPASKPNLFSSVHLYRQSSRAGGAAFTGASRFRCKDCSAAYDTLVELTVHMNKSGHYQDNNLSKDNASSASSSKSRKRSLQDLDGKEDAQKVLKCMFCGHSFDSLQDLSVHMIKTKHYQKVPLKEPIPVMAPKLLAPAKRRPLESARPCSPDSTTGASGCGGDAQRASPAANPSNNRYGYQNGASYTWQFETCKSQILKCMECGSSHDTLQQLTTHMMVTGHFLKVTNSASKKGKQLALDPLAVEKIQGLAEAPSETAGDKNVSPGGSERDGEDGERDGQDGEDGEDQREAKEEKAGHLKYPYLREEDLEQDSAGGGDILKSLANTVASAINKAQTGTPSWSAYPSIHAAYQLSGIIKSVPMSAAVSPPFHQKLPRPIAPKGRAPDPMGAEGPPAPHKDGDIKQDVTADAKDGESAELDLMETDDSDCQDDGSFSSKADANAGNDGGQEIKAKMSPDFSHAADVLAVNPLSALQSVLNNHLGKARNAKHKTSSHGRSVFAHATQKPTLTPTLTPAHPARNKPKTGLPSTGDDQPIDLTKSKHGKPRSPRKYALSDIADMVKVLPKATTPRPPAAPGLPALKLESDVRRFEDVSAEVYSVHKRKGRQSNWNPRHLLILQAQFASSLFLTSEGKYLLSDLGPQERTHISKFTGLSMTTISHWLANVKYQLRKSGGTKFLKNMDTGRPVFYCNDCASQFRLPAAFISHLESHLGFRIRDMCKMAVERRAEADEARLPKVAGPVRPCETPLPDEDGDAKFKCKLCCRTFASNHAVKLHLSKTHSKSPDNHSQYVDTDKD